MSEIVTIDGIPLESWGVETYRVRGHRSPPKTQYSHREIPGREDSLLLSPDGATPPRRIVIEGHQIAGVDGRTVRDDVPGLQALRDQLNWHLQNREVELRIVDTLGRFLRVRIEDHEITPEDPFLVQGAHRVQISGVCFDPRWHEDAITTISFASGPASVILGNAVVRPVVTVTGPLAAPYRISYKGPTGKEFAYMQMTVALGSGEQRIFDCDDTTIVDGAGASRADEWDGCKFVRFDPRHAGSPTGPWPTIEIDPAPAAAIAEYSKAWL